MKRMRPPAGMHDRNSVANRTAIWLEHKLVGNTIIPAVEDSTIVPAGVEWRMAVKRKGRQFGIRRSE